jgi:hypothetical protein
VAKMHQGHKNTDAKTSITGVQEINRVDDQRKTIGCLMRNGKGNLERGGKLMEFNSVLDERLYTGQVEPHPIWGVAAND